MGFRAKNALPRLSPALAGVVLSCLATATLVAQRGQPIEFSSPQSGTVATNLNQLRSKQSGFKQLEEDMSRPFESLSPNNSLGPIIGIPYRPPPRQRIPTRQEKERDDERKNWAFRDLDDMTKGPSAEKIFGLKEYEKNGEEKKPRSAAEKYYQKLDRKRGDAEEGTDNVGVNEDKNSFSSTRSTDRLDLLDGRADQSDQLLRGIQNSVLDTKLGDRAGSLSGSPFSDFVKAGDFQPDRDTARDARVDTFRKMVDPVFASPPASLSSFNQPGDSGRPSLSPASGLGSFSIPTPRDFSSPSLGSLQDVNPRSLQPSWTPALQPASPLKAQPTTLTIPKRKF